MAEKTFTDEECIAIGNLLEISIRHMKTEMRDAVRFTSMKDEFAGEIEYVETLLKKVRS